MSEARIRHFMTETVHTMRPDAPLVEAAARVGDSDVSCIVVCDGESPVGVLTERDVARAYARDFAGGAERDVSSAMSKGVWMLSADARCSEAMQMMTRRGVRRIVVSDEDGGLKGVITQADLLRAHAQEIEIQKQVLEERVIQRTRELEELNLRLESLARVDPMLGIGNRRAMEDELDRLQQRVVRYQRPYAVALFDVDHFKKYNEHYGYAEGDEVLKQVASTIRSSIRAADAMYRYGGEEFLVVFPEVSDEGAAVAAEHVRAAVAELRVLHRESPFEGVTVSAGVAAQLPNETGWVGLVKRADEALFLAKSNGRNRVELAPRSAARQPADLESRVA